MTFGKHFDDDELDELENRAHKKAHGEDLQRNAAHLKQQLSIRQDLPKETLETVRDLFLEGKDIDAIAVLGNELGLRADDGEHWREIRVTVNTGGSYEWNFDGYTVHVVGMRDNVGVRLKVLGVAQHGSYRRADIIDGIPGPRSRGGR